MSFTVVRKQKLTNYLSYYHVFHELHKRRINVSLSMISGNTSNYSVSIVHKTKTKSQTCLPVEADKSQNSMLKNQ
jgi:hypothetical protein